MMQLADAISAYQRTRSGFLVASLLWLVAAVACAAFVLTTVGLNEWTYAAIALAIICLFAFAQNIVRLLYAVARQRDSVAPMSRRYRVVAAAMLLFLSLLPPVAATLLTMQTTSAITLSAGDPCTRGSIDTSCLCEGSGLLPQNILDVSTDLSIGFPLAIETNKGCIPAIGTVYDQEPNRLAGGLDIAVAAGIDAVSTTTMLLASRKAYARVAALRRRTLASQKKRAVA